MIIAVSSERWTWVILLRLYSLVWIGVSPVHLDRGPAFTLLALENAVTVLEAEMGTARSMMNIRKILN
jgi:hypothetical protein